VAAHLLAGKNVDQRPDYPQQTAAAVPYPVQRRLPWDSIDMDFMNLNQTAHGGREFGFIGARMRQQHSVVTGHWQDGPSAHRRLDAPGGLKQDTRHLKVCRFGDKQWRSPTAIKSPRRSSSASR
jgi:L-arabinose isomerase